MVELCCKRCKRDLPAWRYFRFLVGIQACCTTRIYKILGTIASITDSGIPVHFFTGNHDMWVGDYLSDECGVTIHTNPYTTILDGKKFHLAHGEGLGTKDKGYKILLSIFRNKPLRAMYSALHPSIGVGIGQRWSLKLKTWKRNYQRISWRRERGSDKICQISSCKRKN